MLRFLATHAFFTPAPDAAPAGATSAKKTPSKKKAQQAAALPAELEAAAKAAAEGSAAITEATRRLCAARLVGLASHVPGGLGAKAQEGGEQQAQQGGRKKAKVGVCLRLRCAWVQLHHLGSSALFIACTPQFSLLTSSLSCAYMEMAPLLCCPL